MGARWVMAYEGTPGACRVTSARQVSIGQPLEIGREGELALGVEVTNTAISRHAVTVTATAHGWELTVINRNGAVLHPWGQAPELAAISGRDTVNWPLVAVRMLPDTAVSQHWVLIEADGLPVTPAGPIASNSLTETDRVSRPGQLPDGERKAVITAFADQLSWPPIHPAIPLQLKQAASRLGKSISATQDSLGAARDRAARLGYASTGALTEPGYLYALVRAGYVEPPTSFPHRPAPHD